MYSKPLVENFYIILYSKLFYPNDGVVDTWLQDVLIIILI
jgi:hypothetical protein